MTTPGGCTAWAGYEDLPTPVAELHSPQQWCTYLALATDILWAATSRRWRGAGHEAVVSLDSLTGHGAATETCDCWRLAPVAVASRAIAAMHYEPSDVRLPHPDVTAITYISQDGAPFTGSWRLEGAWLKRTDAHGWPVCGGRVDVAYTYGVDPPIGGKAACVELTAELGKAAAPDGDMVCRLPARVRSVSRQGINFEVTDPQEYLERGLTGLTSVDMWIRAVNPKGRAQQARVWSPDILRGRRTS